MNYKIIGGDNQQYGPIGTDTLKQWIASGRAGPRTLAQAEGETDWKPLESFPEFVEALRAAPHPGAPPPGEPPTLPGALDPNALAAAVMAREYRVDTGACLGRGWATFTADFWPILGISALIQILALATNAVYVGILITGPLAGGWMWYFLKKIRGQRAEIGDAFAGFTLAFVQLMLAGLVTSVLAGIGLLLCLLPGIYLLVAWYFTFLLVVDKGLGFWEAMEVSRKVVSQRWWSFFGFALLCFLINLGGLLLLGVGALVTIPWTGLAWTHLYEDVFSAANAAGSADASRSGQAVQPV
jgi:hypothetical protein